MVYLQVGFASIKIVFILRFSLEYYVLKPNLDVSLSWPIFTQKLFGEKRGFGGLCVFLKKKKRRKKKDMVK